MLELLFLWQMQVLMKTLDLVCRDYWTLKTQPEFLVAFQPYRKQTDIRDVPIQSLNCSGENIKGQGAEWIRLIDMSLIGGKHLDL